jgi:hypothetical protein
MHEFGAVPGMLHRYPSTDQSFGKRYELYYE